MVEGYKSIARTYKQTHSDTHIETGTYWILNWICPFLFAPETFSLFYLVVLNTSECSFCVGGRTYDSMCVCLVVELICCREKFIYLIILFLFLQFFKDCLIEFLTEFHSPSQFRQISFSFLYFLQLSSFCRFLRIFRRRESKIVLLSLILLLKNSF